MEHPLFSETDFLYTLFNAIPSAVFIVDSDARILHVNTAATEMFSGNTSFHMKRGGDALNCLHSREVPEGCGKAEACEECTLRSSVIEAISGGKVYRKKAIVTQNINGMTRDSHFLVTTSPFQYQGRGYSLLILEDVSELLQLRSLIPVCAWCRKIRTDENYWQNVEEYLQRHFDMSFSHGICEECYEKKLLGDLPEQNRRGPSSP